MPQKERKIRQPTLLFDDKKIKGCLTFANGSLTYFINRANKQDLIWSFWDSYAESPYYEDPHLENSFFPALTSRENWIPYSETIIIKEGDDVERRGRNYPLGYRVSPNRLDFYVTKEEFKAAFWAVKSLGSKKGPGEGRVLEGQIFGGVRVVLLYDKAFGKASPCPPIMGASPAFRTPHSLGAGGRFSTRPWSLWQAGPAI